MTVQAVSAKQYVGHINVIQIPVDQVIFDQCVTYDLLTFQPMLEAKRPEKPGKKKQQEKKKSNLEIFKEELKAIQVSELINFFSLRR
jgi:hypothetical protein